MSIEPSTELQKIGNRLAPLENRVALLSWLVFCAAPAIILLAAAAIGVSHQILRGYVTEEVRKVLHDEVEREVMKQLRPEVVAAIEAARDQAVKGAGVVEKYAGEVQALTEKARVASQEVSSIARALTNTVGESGSLRLGSVQLCWGGGHQRSRSRERRVCRSNVSCGLQISSSCLDSGGGGWRLERFGYGGLSCN